MNAAVSTLQASNRYGQLPLTFVCNAGQVDAAIHYYAQRAGFGCAFRTEGYMLTFRQDAGEYNAQGAALSFTFVNAEPSAEVEGLEKQAGLHHFFRGNDPAQHALNVPIFRQVTYRGVWTDIDVVITDVQGTLKFDWLLQPGARVEQIRINCEGADAIELDADGNLLFHTTLGAVLDRRPIAYQEIADERRLIACRYVLETAANGMRTIGFELTEPYDATLPLVIDPAILYSTFLGGSGVDSIYGIAADEFGNAYVTGTTTSANFPVTPGAFQTTSSGAEDAFVVKLNSLGNQLLYATYLGGSQRDEGRSIAIDASGHAYVTGFTASNNFPTTAGAFSQTIAGGVDAFVAKLNPDGNGLVYSTLFGGSATDTAASIAIDAQGSAYITGDTGSSDLPITPGAFQPTKPSGSLNAFVTKLNPEGTALVYSTYLGGSGSTNGNGIVVDAQGNAYVAGQTGAATFPTTPGAYQIVYGTGIDAFVTKLNADGTGLIYSTFLGSTGNDDAEDIAIDESGNAYVLGHTTSVDFPTTPGAFAAAVGSRAAFVTKFNPTGSALIYSAIISGSGITNPFSIALNDTRSALITGDTDSPDFPITFDAFQPSLHGTQDAFLTILNPTGSFLEYSTFLGGGSSDIGRSVAVDPQGSIYVAGETFSGDFPITHGVVQPFIQGIDGFITKFGEAANLFVHKFTDRFEVRPGENVVYFIELRNDSSVPLTNIKIDDPFLGFFTFIDILHPFEIRVFHIDFFVPPQHPAGPLFNQVLVTSDQIPEPIKAEAVIIVTEQPSLIATKTANPSAALPGTTVIYRITLINQGNTDLFNVRLFDSLIGLDQVFGFLPIGSSIDVDWPFVIPPDAQVGPSIVNIVQITADNLPQPEQAAAVVEVLPAPRLEIVKSADRVTVLPGETFNFSVTLRNTGNTDLTTISVDDDLAGISDNIPFLAVGQEMTLSIPFLVPLETPPRIYTNTALATSDQTSPITGTVDVTVAPAPLLGLRKLPSQPSAEPGQAIFYSAVVANVGNIPLTDVRLTDPLLAFDQSIGDLAVGERRDIDIPFTVPQDAVVGSVIENTLTGVSAQTGTSQVEAIVDVTGAGLSLTKTVSPQTAAPGEVVQYTLTVQNLLSDPQTNVNLNDSTLGLSEIVPSIPAGGTITRTIPFLIPADAPSGSVITNTFTVVSDQSPLRRAEAEVVVIVTPIGATTLVVRKLPDRTIAAPGVLINYTVEVRNTGPNPATDVVVRDSLTGTQTIIPVIAAGASALARFTFTIPTTALQGTVIANRVVVDWTERAPDVAPAQSEARVVVAISKDLIDTDNEVIPPIARPGEAVSKIIRVNNTSGRTLTNVRVIDLLMRFNTIIPTLAPGESREFDLTFTNPQNAVGGTTFRNNVVVFSDQTPLQQQLMLIETAVLPAALLTQTVDRPEGHPGETVVFTVRIRNTGNVDLINGILTGQLLQLRLRTDRFEINADETIRIPFVLPDVDEDTIVTSEVTAISNNFGPLHATVSVRVIVDEE